MNAYEKCIKMAGTPANLSRLMGVTPQSTSNWKHKLPAKQCVRLNEVTGVPLLELLRYAAGDKRCS